MIRKTSVLLLTLLLSGNLAYGQELLGAKPKKARTVDDYKARTLKEVTTKGSDAESKGNKEETMIVNGDILPSRVRVIYTGSARPLPQIKKEVLRQFALRYAGFPEFYTVPYETEILFVENGAKYWLAVKKEPLRHLEQELKQGEEVDLFLIRVGTARIADEWESMLLVESFQKPKQATLALGLHAQTAPDAAELTKLLKEFLAGASHNDAAIHDRFWAEDLIYTRSSGRRIGKADLMRDLRSAPAAKPGEPMTAYTAEDIRIQQYGNTAIVAFRLVGVTASGEKSQVANYLNTGTFVKRNGTWRVVSWQATKMPQPEPAESPTTQNGKDNEELKQLCDEDQSDRNLPEGKSINWAIVGPRDKARLKRVKELYLQNRLQTANDYDRAALVLQHGEEPEDFLLAHEFWVVAIIKGKNDKDTRMLAAASEDRFLMNVGRPQRFGTQFRSEGNGPIKLYSVSPGVTDELRRLMGIHSLAEIKAKETELNKH